MNTENDTSKPEDSHQEKTGEGCSGATCSAFAWARHNDVTVNVMLKANACHTEIIGVMAKEKTQLLARIMELEAIAPRKITLPDGRVMVWHCPDHLLPNADVLAQPTQDSTNRKNEP